MQFLRFGLVPLFLGCGLEWGSLIRHTIAARVEAIASAPVGWRPSPVGCLLATIHPLSLSKARRWTTGQCLAGIDLAGGRRGSEMPQAGQSRFLYQPIEELYTYTNI